MTVALTLPVPVSERVPDSLPVAVVEKDDVDDGVSVTDDDGDVVAVPLPVAVTLLVAVAVEGDDAVTEPVPLRVPIKLTEPDRVAVPVKLREPVTLLLAVDVGDAVCDGDAAIERLAVELDVAEPERVAVPPLAVPEIVGVGIALVLAVGLVGGKGPHVGSPAGTDAEPGG